MIPDWSTLSLTLLAAFLKGQADGTGVREGRTGQMGRMGGRDGQGGQASWTGGQAGGTTYVFDYE